MELFLLSFLVMALSVGGLALGVIVRKRPIGVGCGPFSGPGTQDTGCKVCTDAARSERILAPHDWSGDTGLLR
ncbi:MAG: hypothetical protein GY789_04355 [Hyphomicrobiales bacterium]|nr:hypothetical protein [Hyphomicrobiales bacterium]